MGQTMAYQDAGLSVYDDGVNDLMWQDAPHPALISPLRGYGIINHFMDYSPDKYTVTAVSAGTGTSTIAQTDAARGVIRINTAANEDDGAQMQTVGEALTLTTSNKVWFDAYIQVTEEITQSDWFIGFGALDTTFLAGNPTSKAGFIKHDGDANIDFVSESAASAGVHTSVVDTWVLLGFKWDGVNLVPYINGAADTSNQIAAASASTAAEMSFTFAYLNGAGTSQNDGIECDFYRLSVVDV